MLIPSRDKKMEKHGGSLEYIWTTHEEPPANSQKNSRVFPHAKFGGFTSEKNTPISYD